MKNDINLYEKIPVEEKLFPLRLLHLKLTRLLPHWHEHLEMIFILNGSCNFTCGGSTHFIEKGDLLIINENEIHFFDNEGEVEYYCIIINPSFFNDVSFENTIFKSHIKNDTFTEKCFTDIFYENDTQNSGYDIQIKGITSLLIVYLIRNYKAMTISDVAYDTHIEKLNRINTILSYIENNYTEPISVDELAQKAFLSKGYFYHYFKNVTGQNLTDYINQLRIKKAVNLLKNTSASITEIASEVGYSDINYFSRTFKKFMGIPPSKY